MKISRALKGSSHSAHSLCFTFFFFLFLFQFVFLPCSSSETVTRNHTETLQPNVIRMQQSFNGCKLPSFLGFALFYPSYKH